MCRAGVRKPDGSFGMGYVAGKLERFRAYRSRVTESLSKLMCSWGRNPEASPRNSLPRLQMLACASIVSLGAADALHGTLLKGKGSN